MIFSPRAGLNYDDHGDGGGRPLPVQLQSWRPHAAGYKGTLVHFCRCPGICIKLHSARDTRLSAVFPGLPPDIMLCVIVSWYHSGSSSTNLSSLWGLKAHGWIRSLCILPVCKMSFKAASHIYYISSLISLKKVFKPRQIKERLLIDSTNGVAVASRGEWRDWPWLDEARNGGVLIMNKQIKYNP